MSRCIERFVGNAFIRRAAIAILAVIAFAFPQIAMAQPDPLVGTWNYIPDKSTYKPDRPRYKSMTITVAPDGQMTWEGVDAQGKAVKGTFNVVADGKPHPITGMGTYDNATWNKFSANATGYVYMKGRSTVGIGSRILSRDGGVLTFSEKTIDGKGKETGSASMIFTKPGYVFASIPPPTSRAPVLSSGLTADETAASAALEKGDDDAAITLFSKIIDSKQQTLMLYYDHISRGIAYAKKNQNDQAFADFDAAVKLKPDDSDARFRRGSLHVQAKRYDQAIQDFTEVVKVDPMNAMAYRLRAYSYNTLGNDKAAGPDYDKACELNKELCQN